MANKRFCLPVADNWLGNHFGNILVNNHPAIKNIQAECGEVSYAFELSRLAAFERATCQLNPKIVARRVMVHCKQCGSKLRRISRKGFLQLNFFPLFGFYPWECPICRTIVMRKKQHQRKRRDAQETNAD